MTSREGSVKDLKLFGEHINLSSRARVDDTKKFRPQSALYTTTKYTPEHNRRPFSAGTEPTSPKLHSFLRHTQTDRPDSFYLRNSEYFKDLSIPGTVESSTLCDKLVKEPIFNNLIKQRFYYDLPVSDNNSENSSLETCISLGTKIKAKAQTLEKPLDGNYEIEGTPIQLKKYRPFVGLSMETFLGNEHGDMKKSLNIIPEKDINSSSTKLSIHLPINKEDNTSSGVSSSSDIHNFGNIQNKKPNNEISMVYNENLSTNRLKFKRPTNSSISWFPQVIQKNEVEDHTDDLIEDDTINNKCFEYKSADNLVGRVSFAKNKIDQEPNENIESSYDIFSTFDTQLSLVEEESSQDSEKSPNQLSHNYNGNSNKSISDNVFLYDSKYNTSIFTTKDPLPSISGHNFRKTEQNNEIDEVILKNYYNDSKIEDDESEMKFKALENKYKNEKKYNDNVSSEYSIELKPSKQDSAYLDRALLFDNEHNFEVQNSSQNNYLNYTKKFQSGICDINENLDSNKKSQKLDTTVNFGEADNPNNNFADEQQKYQETIDPTLHNIKQNRYFDIPNYDSSIPTKENEDTCKSDYNEGSKSQKKVTESDSNNFEANEKKEKDNITDYPLYLEESETKTYTSKVIEEYKQEIASINNFHDLTLEDLRKKCDEFKNHIGFDSTMYNKNVINISTSGSEDDIDKVPIFKTSQEKYSENKKYNKTNTNKRTVINDSETVDNFNSLETSYNSSKETLKKDMINKNSMYRNVKEKQKTSKPKKRVKKKDPIYENKNKFGMDDLSSKKFFTKKNDFDAKKLPESVSDYQKSNRNAIKFRAQKIMLTKSSTKTNHTVYFDDDKDVISWMETRIHTPLGDVSSCETTDRNKIVKENKYNDKERLNRSSVRFEDEIIPISKLASETPYSTNSCLNSNHSENFISTSPQDTLYTKNAKESPSRVTAEVNTLKSSERINPNESFELNNALDDDSMIADIYSTLNDIDIHCNIQEKDIITSKSLEETFDTTTTEYKDIANYLERIEKSANEDMSSFSHNQPLFALKVEELMELSKSELAHRAVVGVLAAGRASAIASGLRGALTRAAKESAARLKAIKTSAKQEVTIAAAQTNHAVARHQKFIEQLVNEKKALTERIEQLAGTAAGAEARRGRAARASAERLQLELRNQRQRLTAAHQRDKQAWLKHHTQKIKDMTVKELESEFQEIEKKHAIQLVKAQQDAELALAELRDQHTKEIRKMKDNAARQLDDELDKERFLATERLEQKRAEWEAAMVSASERVEQEARDAARRAEESIRNARHQADLWKIEQEEDLARQKNIIEKQIDEKKFLIKEELKQLKEKMIKEFDDYKVDYSKKQSVILKEKESEIHLMLRRERDKEIEKVIDCMETEAQEGRNNMQENIKKMKEKYESDVKALEDSEKIAIHRCNDLREQLGEVQEQCSKHQITITQLEGKLKQAEEINSQNTVQTDMLIKAAELDLQSQLQNMQQKHKDEMHQLFAKVKVVIARKDDALTLARRETSSLRERCIRLEAKRI
ncbi:centrosomal protein dilatory [Arctopsyche grandis]|uniref:centrosomal protein dilatory n=1 Tax=Arctopsyche grandis TaxID=121162 RepID=UPI00406D7733